MIHHEAPTQRDPKLPVSPKHLEVRKTTPAMKAALEETLRRKEAKGPRRTKIREKAAAIKMINQVLQEGINQAATLLTKEAIMRIQQVTRPLTTMGMLLVAALILLNGQVERHRAAGL